MSLASRISRMPRAHDADRGREAARAVGASGDLARLVQGAAGCSPHLHRLVMVESEWAAAALSGKPEAAADNILADVAGLSDAEVGSGLRRAKRRMALLVALADLGGAWRLAEVTGALTRLADAATEKALSAALRVERRRGRLPDDPLAGGIVVFAMGKMGAFELNYSSDIDLICLFDEGRHPPADFPEIRAALIRATRRMTATLSDNTGDGYVFRTDLRLRPDPSVTPVCMGMDAAERYYEALGRTWERAAWIKARPAAGDIAAGQQFLDRMRPFVWRRHLDFAAVRDAHDMRQRIRDYKALHGEGLERRDVKLGPGGIREIEFFTQTRQIIAGGRDPSLRVRGTVEALDRLVRAGWVSAEDAAALGDDYAALREIEHRLQMIADAQTHALPGDRAGFDRLAVLCGRETDELRADLAERFERVSRLTEPFFAPSPAAPAPALTEPQREVAARWRRYPALRSPRAIEIFEQLAPAIFDRVERTADPEQTLRHLETFLSGLPAGVQIFSLFQSNDQLLDLVVDVSDSAPQLARYLGHNAGVLDAVIGGDFFAPWPGAEDLERQLDRVLAAAPDYERQLDAARRWAKEWHFRVGVHLLRGIVGPDDAGRQYAELAEAFLRALWPRVIDEFAATHGPPPGRGAAVIGMGSLGTRRLTATSDLDLIVVYDAGDASGSEGRRPLAVRPYYARLTQALVTALSARTAEGRLYQIDMRLRPSGRQGPVATALEAFRIYQREEAWTWEHLAVTRARPVAGNSTLGAEVAGFLAELLGAPRDPGPVLRDTADMRRRLLEAKGGGGRWAAKTGPGRLQDIELVASASALIGSGVPADLRDRLAASGLFTGDEIDRLVAADDLFWGVQAAGRLLTGGELTEAATGAALIRRVSGCDDPAALADHLDAAAASAAAAIDRAMADHQAEAAPR